ncbi:MAG: TolC family protein [Planctomycetota bacterium]
MSQRPNPSLRRDRTPPTPTQVPSAQVLPALVLPFLVLPLLVLPSLGLLPGCGRYNAALNPNDRALVDRGLTDLETSGTSIGAASAVDLDEAARRFADGQVASVGAPQTAGDQPNPNAEASGSDDQQNDPPQDLGPLELSLADVRSSVIESSLSLRRANFKPRSAREKLEAERAKFDAVFVAGVEYSDEEKPKGDSNLFTISGITGLSGSNGSFTELAQEREKTEGDVGLDLPLPTGGKVKLRQSFESDDKSAGPLASTEDRAASSFSISQPLLRGAGVAINTASIRIAELSLGATAAETRLTAIKLLAMAEKTYWKLYGSQQIAEVARDQLRLATGIRGIVQDRIEGGLIAPIQRYAADLALAQQFEAVVTAETEVRLRARELSRMLNREDMPLDDPREIVPLSDPSLVRYDLDRPALVQRGLAERLELVSLELKLAQDALRVDLARNAALPVLLLDVGYGLADRDGTVLSAASRSYGFNNPKLGIGARLSVPVTNNAAEAKVRRSLIERLQRLASIDERRLFIRQEVLDAADVLELAWLRVLAARQAVIAAGANFDAQEQLLTDGLANAQDVQLALQALGKARQIEVKAVVEYQVAQIDLAFATGVLLGYANAEIEPVAAQRVSAE